MVLLKTSHPEIRKREHLLCLVEHTCSVKVYGDGCVDAFKLCRDPLVLSCMPYIDKILICMPLILVFHAIFVA